MNNGNVDFDRDVDIDVNRSRYNHHPVAAQPRSARPRGGGRFDRLFAAAHLHLVVENGTQYNYCGGVYYQPIHSGSTVSYVVVNP